MDWTLIALIIAGITTIVLAILYSRTLASQDAERRHSNSLKTQLADQAKRYDELIEKRAADLQAAEDTYTRKLKKLLNKSTSEINAIKIEYGDIIKEKDQKYRVLLAQKKSSEVRTGYILEKVAPLFEDFPADLASDTVIPLFDVVDYLIFKDDEIIFCEVKSGDSSLSQRQKRFKQNVKEGRVTYRAFRKKAPDNIEEELEKK